MFLYWLELKKLLSSTAVWGFIASCLLFNIYFVISSSNDNYADFVGSVSNKTGYILGQSFDEKLNQITVYEGQTEYLYQLKSDTYGKADVFDGYKTEGIAKRYIAAAGATGSFAKAMQDKYSALQKVVEKKAKNNESLTLYFAAATYNQHQLLFNSLTGLLLIEGVLVSVLIILLSVGYENVHGTEDIVYSTKKGRRILPLKLKASISMGLYTYALLAIITFLVYFRVNEYGSIWGSSVSSIFNYRSDVIAGDRPFLTWYNFNVLTYFLATLGMSAGLILCFSLMAFGIGVLIRNHYIGFLVFILLNTVFIVLPSLIPSKLTVGLFARYYSMLSPVWLWLKHSIWFTDGDVDILWPYFETLGLCVSFLLSTAFCLFTTIYFRKKDIT